MLRPMLVHSLEEVSKPLARDVVADEEKWDERRRCQSGFNRGSEDVIHVGIAYVRLS